MKRLRSMLLGPVVCCSIAVISAASTQPDRSTPKAAAVALFNSITAGDRDTVAAAFYAENDPQRALAAAMADMIVSGKKLADAAKGKFGQAGDPIGRGMLDPADLTKLEQATVKQTAADA